MWLPAKRIQSAAIQTAPISNLRQPQGGREYRRSRARGLPVGISPRDVRAPFEAPEPVSGGSFLRGQAALTCPGVVGQIPRGRRWCRAAPRADLSTVDGSPVIRAKVWSYLAVGLTLSTAPLSARASVDSELAFHRGVVAYGEGRLDPARQDFERVLAEDPEDREALRYLALILKAQGDPGRALELQERALALDPGDRELVFDRGVTLLEVGRNAEARAAFQEVLAQDPDHAQASFYAGVAAYRTGDHKAALPYLERAASLDPSLAVQTHYYSGLSEASIGDLSAAVGSFSVVAEQSPVSPLGRSAASLSDELRASREAAPYAIALSSGLEWDSNPLFASDESFLLANGQPSPDHDPTLRGVFTAAGSVRLFADERSSVAAGYDGYLSLNTDGSAHEVDLQTHAGWLSGGTIIGPVRLGLRYDYAYTFLDL